MDTNILKYQAFLECVQRGSITAAARALSYSQSGVSRMIADLEREWGVVLLDRGRGGARLTSDGECLLSTVKEICEAHRRLRMQVDDLNGLRTGSIRMGVFSSVATHWLPHAISAFRADYPDIDYELLTGDYAEIERWVADGRVDLGFLPHRPTSRGLSFEELASDELLAVLPKGHPLAGRGSVEVAALCDEPFILLEKGGDDEVTSIFSAADLEARVCFTTWDDYAIMSMVESGLGISILPALILRRAPYRIEARRLDPCARRHIGVVRRAGGPLALAAERFLPYLARGVAYEVDVTDRPGTRQLA